MLEAWSLSESESEEGEGVSVGLAERLSLGLSQVAAIGPETG